MTQTKQQTALARFRAALARPDLLPALRRGLIGDGIAYETPFGTRHLLYADYVASGRALRQIEAFVAEEVLPFYANSHTEASFCGETMTRMREEARATIHRLVGAGDDGHVVFTGSGATSGLNRIVAMLGIPARLAAGQKVTVLLGPYEHHSNILPWRDSGAQVIEISEATTGGGPDLDELHAALRAAEGALVIGSFSAASNVTGIMTDTDAVTRILRSYGALVVWDYAAGAPYLPMDMGADDAAKDAIVFSPHKFPGGPGASGILVLRDTLALRPTPTAPGGGSVTFVSPWRHVYSRRVEDREEAGTPNVVGDIRAALVMLVKDAVGVDAILARETRLRHYALDAWAEVPQIELLGRKAEVEALPIFSFRIRDGKGGHVHHQLFTRMLSDHYGIQVRGGCACAGPYAHRLLGLDRDASDSLMDRLEQGAETEKPGWIRLNLSYLHSDAQAERIVNAVAELAHSVPERGAAYRVDPANARFRVAS